MNDDVIRDINYISLVVSEFVKQDDKGKYYISDELDSEQAMSFNINYRYATDCLSRMVAFKNKESQQ